MRNLIKIVLLISTYLLSFFNSNLYSSNKEFTDNIDTFSGYLRINQKYISIPGPNGMNIDLVHSYTGSRLLADELSSGYGWHLNNMQIVLEANYIKKKKKSAFSALAFWHKSKKKPYGFYPYSAKLIFPNGKFKDFVITRYSNNSNHKNGFHYASWPEEMKSNDNWLIINSENSHEMYLYDPNGNKYTFSVNVSNFHFNLGASLVKIEDLNGNWIQYNYEKRASKKHPNLTKNYLKNITSNDGREINFYYSELHVDDGESNFIVLNKVTAHNSSWEYKYKALKLKHNPNKVPVLSEVIYPDGSSWQYTYNQSTKDSRLLTQIKAPNGLITRYDYQYYKKDNKDFEQIAAKYQFDPKYNLLGVTHYHIDKEKIRCPQIDSNNLICIKNYIETDYGRKDYIYASGNYRIKKSGKKYFGPIWSHGLLLQKTITDYKLNKILQDIKYHWDKQLISSSKHFLDKDRVDNNFFRPILIKKTQNRENTNYIINYLEHDYFGRAKKIKEEGPSGTREKFYEYKDYENIHVFNLLTSYKNGESFKKYKYNYKGQLINKNINNSNFYYQYHNTGELASVTDSKEFTTEYYNYYRGKPVKIIYEDKTEEVNNYNYYGLLTSHINERGFITEFQYDNLGRKIKQILPKGVIEEIFYYPNYTVKQKGNYKEVIEYDYLNNLKSIAKFDKDELLTKKKFSYDFLGRKVFESKEFNNSYGNQDDGVYKSYDAINRIVYINNKSQNESLIYKYNYLPKNGIEKINPKRYANTIYYQSFGISKYQKPIEIINANDVHTYIDRAQDGLINEIKRGTVSRQYFYNNKRFLSKYSDPETGDLDFKYNPNGKLIETMIDRRHFSFSYYDKRNRLLMTHHDYPTRSDYYCYDEAGNLIRTRTNDSEWLYKYDANNNLIKATFSYKNQLKKYEFQYEYDELNNLASIVYPSNKKIIYNPNVLGNPRQVGGYINSINYYPNLKVKSFSYHNGLLFGALLNLRGDIKSMSYNSDNLIQIDYEYDQLNNVKNIEDSRGDINFFEYDKINRLSKSYNSKATTNLKYDVYDNILEKLSNKKQEYYMYDSSNRLIKHFIYDDIGKSEFEYKYDNRGRVIYDGIHEYSYNAKNQIRAIDNNIYVYDGNRHIISVGDNKYLYDHNGKKLVEFDKDGHYKEYYYLNNNMIAKSEFINNETKNTYFHFDQFNSLIASSDERGILLNRLSEENLSKFHEDNGRIFDSVNKRFLNTSIFNTGNLSIFNRYSI